MRSSTYVFLVLAATCALTLRWGVTDDVFSLGSAYTIALLFAVACAISLDNAIQAYRSN